MSDAIDNRRKFARYPAGNVEASITCNGDTFDATVCDESIGGLCLIVNGRPSRRLFIGDEVSVNHRDELGTMYVRSAQQVDGDRVRLGLSWDPPNPDDIPAEELQAKSELERREKEDKASGKKGRRVVSDEIQMPSDAERSQRSGSNPSDTVSIGIVEQVFYTHGDVSVVCDVVGIAPGGDVRVQINGEKTFLADGRKLITRTRAKRLDEISADGMLQTLSGFYQIEPTADAILAHEFS